MSAAADSQVRIDVTDPHFYDNPDEAIRWLHKQSPVYLCNLGSMSPRRIWVVSKWRDIRAVEGDPELFVTRYGAHLGEGLLHVEGLGGDAATTYADPRFAEALKSILMHEGSDHRRLRNLAKVVFAPKRIRELESLVRRCTDECLDGLRPGETTNFVPIAERLPMDVICEFLGVGTERTEDFKRWSDAVFASFEPSAAADFAAMSEMFDFLEAEVAERRRRPRSDAITDLVQSEYQGSRLTDGEILMWCWLLLVGGLETTANLITGGTQALLRWPDEKRKLLDDPSLIPNAIEEMLRWVTPDLNMCRTAARDCTLAGTEIQAGDLVFMSYLAANRDPEVFENPFRFDVSRRGSASHLSFGFGPHYCVGAPLARLEAQVFFERFLVRFPASQLAGTARRGLSTRVAKLENLPVLTG